MELWSSVKETGREFADGAGAHDVFVYDDTKEGVEGDDNLNVDGSVPVGGDRHVESEGSVFLDLGFGEAEAPRINGRVEFLLDNGVYALVGETAIDTGAFKEVKDDPANLRGQLQEPLSECTA